jgi:hypothetical protein
MIPSLLQLWLATVYVVAVAVGVNHGPAYLTRLHAARAYQARHRAGTTPPPLVHWLTAHRDRVTAWLAKPDDAMPMIVPDFDSDLGGYQHGNGAGRYAHLRQDEMDARAVRDQTLADKGLALRSPWGSEEWADVWADEMAGVT